MITKRNQEGYLLIDHRNSPGMPASLVGPDGVAVPAGVTFESATITCCHCNCVVILNPDRTRQRGYCAKCDQYVCDNPICSQECRPFRELLDSILAKIITTRNE